MKIRILFVFALSLFAANSFAQNASTTSKNYDQGFRLGVGLNAGYAVNDPYKLVLGADTRLQYDLSKIYSLTLTTGSTNMFVSQADGSDLGFIPVKGGFKAFIWNDSFYVMGEAGAAIAVTNGYNKTSLLLAPSIGYATKYVDISVHYDHYNDFVKAGGNKGVGQVGVRLAYGFQL